MSQKESGKRPQQKMAPPSFPPPSCPRCFSDNTKFCYYNNYTVSQPRYYCKVCRRYWTHGGALRNIPTGGASRKRGRIDSSSSTSQVLNIPPPSTPWGLGANSDNIGGGTIFKQPVTETMISFINGGGRLNQMAPFRFSPRGESLGGGVNMTAFDSVSVGFSGGATLNSGFRDFGSFPAVQGPQHHPLPQSVWTMGRNMALNNTSTTSTRLSNPNNFVSIARDPAAAASNAAEINEWSELNDIGYDEDDPLRNYKPPSP